ncbi:hypothetical protein JVT61DRAFT_10537 [Boletus reticuloceps]|uniref:Uncharacterized protein n=1 Tax=Boletus reticuloceps TaxID=495285 RepID=A0A8I2YVB3_9AGAM|nr:hypothetical protein JVT61DRAFT_10537 [Boletus reticuloceps]
MAPTRHSNSSTTASSRPKPSQMTRPARANAGKAGYLSQLRKTSEALDRPQREQVKDLLENEPVNHLASTPHCPRKKKTGKQCAKATTLEDVNSDPLEADSSQIAPSGPDGRFGLQPQAPTTIWWHAQAKAVSTLNRIHAIILMMKQPRWTLTTITNATQRMRITTAGWTFIHVAAYSISTINKLKYHVVMAAICAERM